MGDFFMEDNYLIQSKIHTRAIVTLMENIVAKKSASISDYHDIFIHWISWFHVNEAMYENLSDPNKGEHLEVILAKLRVTTPGFESCARTLLNDIVSIMSIYRSNTEFFSSLYQNRETLRDMMWDHVNELDKKFDPTIEILAKRRKVDYELERLLCMYRRDTKMYYKALDELETKYTVTINPDNPQFWFSQSEDMYREHDKKYNEFLNYKGRCMTSVSSNYAECAFMTAERIHNSKASREEIALSLEGTWDEDLLFMLKQSLDAYDFFLSQVSDCDTEIEKLLSLYGARIDSDNAELVRCKRKKSRSKNAPKMDIENFAYQLWGVNVFEIPGLKDTAVMHLIGELGHDFIDKFESAEKFSSWCNLAPNNKISGGKILSSRLMKRKNPVGQIFRTAAAPLARDKGEIGNYYRRMKAKSGALQANVATAHKMAKIFYTMVKNKVAYDARKVGLNERELTERKIAKLERALTRLKNAS